MHSDSLRLLMAGFVMGWGPCLTHSAPLLLPYIGATKGHWKDDLKLGLAFSGGRLVALACLGGITTVAFSHINQFFPPHRSGWLYGIVALFMIALDVLKHVTKCIPSLTVKGRAEPIFHSFSWQEIPDANLDQTSKIRLAGRYGEDTLKVVGCGKDGDLERLPCTTILWVELRWAARTEAVVHLDDLLLRRTQLGIVIKEGGFAFLDRIRAICCEELGWDNDRWQKEEQAYKELWRRCYRVPLS